MFYEIDMAEEHIQSIINAVETVDNKENIQVDLFFNISEYFERIDTSKISKQGLLDKFNNLINIIFYKNRVLLSLFHIFINNNKSLFC